MSQGGKPKTPSSPNYNLKEVTAKSNTLKEGMIKCVQK